jgi:hypothetical protein
VGQGCGCQWGRCSSAGAAALAAATTSHYLTHPAATNRPSTRTRPRRSGFRYLASLSDTTTTGVQGHALGSGMGENDIRGVAVHAGSLFGGSTSLDGYPGVYRIGAGLPTAPGGGVEALAGVATSFSFVFENATSLWVAVDTVGWARGTLVRYLLTGGGTWAVERAVELEADTPVYSVGGRYEEHPGSGAPGCWVVYAASATKIYRHVPSQRATTAIYDLTSVYADVSQTAIRGVVPVPRAGPCAPTPTPTGSSSPSASQSGTPSGSSTRSPSQSRSRSASAAAPSPPMSPSKPATACTPTPTRRPPPSPSCGAGYATDSPTRSRSPAAAASRAPSATGSRSRTPSASKPASAPQAGGWIWWWGWGWGWWGLW